MTPGQQHKLEQKEASAALELLNEIEKQKQQDRLDELKRNKQKLLEMLKQKETESAELARLYTSHTSQKSLNDSRSNDNKVASTLTPALSSSLQRKNDFVYPLELNTDLDAAENELDLMLSSKTSENHHSPSDLLWNQMKTQLNMRENLRTKKNELEELIRDENNSDRTELEFKSSLNTASAPRNSGGQNMLPDESNSNKIINGYRDFFLKNKSNANKLARSNVEGNDDYDDEHYQYYDETDEEEIIMKRYVPSASKQGNTTYISEKKSSSIQQQNVCSADELIKENYDTNDFDSCDDDEDQVEEGEEEEKDQENKEQNEYDNEEDEEEENQSDYEADMMNSKKTGNKDNLENVFAKYVDKNQPKNSSLQTDKQLADTNILNSLNSKFNDLIMNQQQLNESIQRNFSQLLSKSMPNTLQQQQQQQQQPEEKRRPSNPSNNAYLMASQFQFQTQMQVQQLMFNLNAAYHEIATQRSEMAQLNEQMKSFNSRLTDLTNHKVNIFYQVIEYYVKLKIENHVFN